MREANWHERQKLLRKIQLLKIIVEKVQSYFPGNARCSSKFLITGHHTFHIEAFTRNDLQEGKTGPGQSLMNMTALFLSYHIHNLQHRIRTISTREHVMNRVTKIFSSSEVAKMQRISSHCLQETLTRCLPYTTELIIYIFVYTFHFSLCHPEVHSKVQPLALTWTTIIHTTSSTPTRPPALQHDPQHMTAAMLHTTAAMLSVWK